MIFPWFAIHARGRYEALAEAHLLGKGYECFLPLHKSPRRWSDRFKEIEQPLFPGYLFCRFNPQERLPILTTPGVTCIVGASRVPAPVDEREIEAIRSVLRAGIPSEPWKFVRIGEKVTIDHGPLAGLTGILVDFRGHHRLVLSVTLLQRSIAVHVDSGCVRPIAQHLHLAGNLAV